jgi:hypothetical protein
MTKNIVKRGVTELVTPSIYEWWGFTLKDK